MNNIGTVYLCGPIQNCTDTECVAWREEAKRLWPGVALDPLRRDYRGKELDNPEKLVSDDLNDIDNSDALVVWFDRPSVGTAMEIFYACTTARIPVFVVDARPERTGPLSAWLVRHTTELHTTLEGALASLHTYLSLAKRA